MTLTIRDEALCEYLTKDQYTRKRYPSSLTAQTIPPGTHVDYLGHVPGGAVKVRFENKEVYIDPNATIELS